MKLVDKNNKILKTKCDEHIISEHSEKLVYDMIVTMQEKDAIGLAAPQVGENTALMIIGHKDTGFVVCINPMWDKAEDSEDEELDLDKYETKKDSLNIYEDDSKFTSTAKPSETSIDESAVSSDWTKFAMEDSDS